MSDCESIFPKEFGKTELAKYLIEQTTDAIILTDSEGRIQWVNPAFEDLTGWALPDIRTLTPGSFLQTEKTCPKTVAQLGSAIRQKKPVQVQILNVTRNGKEYWANLDIKPVKDDAGRVHGFVALQRDITILKMAQKRSRAEIARAMDGLEIACALSGNDGRFTYMNRAHQDMFGISTDQDITTIHYEELYFWQDLEQFERGERQKLNQSGAWHGILRCHHADGQMFTQNLSLFRIETGEVLWITHSSSRYERTQKNITHGQERDHSSAQQISNATGSSNATDKTYPLSKGPRSSKDVHDLGRLMVKAAALVERERTEMHSIVVNTPEPPITVTAHEPEFLQLLTQLIMRGMSAMQGVSGQITLDVPSDVAHITTREPDIGIVLANQKYTFLTITDEGHSTARYDNTTWFGTLATMLNKEGIWPSFSQTAKVIRDNEGALWLDGASGQGTSVTIAWPSPNLVSNTAKAAQSRTARSSKLNGLTILVVDHQQSQADLIDKTLEDAGATVISVDQAEEAYDLLQKHSATWSLVFTGFDMPKLDGVALARCAANVNPPVPTVLITDKHNVAHAHRSLFYDIVYQPIRSVDLIAAAQRVARGKA